MALDYSQRALLAKLLSNTANQQNQQGGLYGALAQGLAGVGQGVLGAQNANYEKQQREAFAAAAESGDASAIKKVLAGSEIPDDQASYRSLVAQQLKPKDPIKLGAGDVLLDPATYQEKIRIPEKPNLPSGYQINNGRASLIPGIDPSFAKKSDGTNVNINTKFENEYNKTLGKGLAEQRIKYGEDANTARNTLNNLDVIENAMNSISTGQLEPAKASLAAFVESVGGDPKRYNLPSVTNAQTFNAASNQIVLDLAQSLKGAFSDKDIAFIKQMAPELGKNPQANKQISALLREGAKRQVNKYEDALSYEQEHGDIGGFEKTYQDKIRRNPINYGFTPAAKQPNSGDAKIVNGVSYVKKNGEWYTQ